MEETTNKSGMSTGAIIGIAIIVAIVFGGGAYAYVNSKAEKDKEALNAQITELQSQVSSATAGWKTYTNDKYGFNFKYPTNFSVQNFPNTSPSDSYLIVRNENSTTDPKTFELRINVLESSRVDKDTKLTFEENVIKIAQRSCDADGPSGSVSCPSVKSKMTFKTTSGIEGNEVYLNEQNTNTSGAKTTVTRGPIYGLNILDNGKNNAWMIEIVPDGDGVRDPSLTNQIITQIAQSVTQI